MDFFEVVEKRKSIRSFSQMPVERELLDKMIDAASMAPSSKNSKSSAFMIIEDKDTLEALGEMREHGSSTLKRATAAIVVIGNPSKTDLWVENASISATYLLLSATALDLCACWIHVNKRVRHSGNDSETAEDYVKRLLGIREDMGVLCVIALGHPQQQEE